MLLSLLATVTIKHGAIMVSNNLPISPEALRDFAEVCVKGFKSRIVIIDVDQGERKDQVELAEQFRKSGFEDTANARFSKAEPKQLEFLEGIVGESQAIVVAGYDQKSLLRIFNRDWCQRVFGKFLERGGTWFGIGPGATIVGDRIVVGDKIQLGLSIFDGIITTDYYDRHKELSLRNAYFGSRLQLGVGLNHDEWIVFRDGIIGLPQVFLRE